ncbi:MAG: hemerythrin domain-containing protein, partial [Candidatus Binatia bacterium]
MSKRIYRFLVDDHARLSELLDRASCRADQIDLAAYAAFRGGLLRHIGMEEKILLPFIQKKRGGDPLPIAAKLRLDHGALASLLVPTPTPGIIATLREVLEKHNPIEEGAGGLYEICQALVGAEEEAL